jgi:ribosomal protein S18 acetylase RimI-like enzyme
MAKKVKVRPATEDDAERIATLAAEFAGYLKSLGDTTTFRFTRDTYLRDGFGANPAFAALAAESSGEVVGYLLYHFGYDCDRAVRVMYIVDLYVGAGHRRRGAGRSLMARAKEICRESDAFEMLWSVYRPNRLAHDFYRALGAKYVKDLDFMYLKVGSRRHRGGVAGPRR